MAEKKFIEGVFIDERTFPDGGSIISVTLTDKLVAYYEANKTKNGKGNNQMKMDIKKSRDGTKLYAEQNLWKPKPQDKPVEQPVEDDGFGDDIIPF